MPILIFKDFWYQEWTNQMQPYYVMWPIRCNSIIWPVYLWFKTRHSHWTAVVVLAVVVFLFDSLRKRSHSPWLNSQVLRVFKLLLAHWLKTAVLFQWMEGHHTDDLHELVFKLNSEVTLEPPQRMRGKHGQDSRPGASVPKTSLLYVLCIGFFMLSTFFERDAPFTKLKHYWNIPIV